jgi:TonB family protein
MTDKRPHIKPEELAGLIRQYLAGELDDKAMHALERQALDDPFLADALEGYAMHTPEQTAHQEDLTSRLSERVASKGRVRPMFYRIAAAAILLLMFSAGWFLWDQQRRTPIAGVSTPNAAQEVAPVLSEHGDTAPSPANADHLAKKITTPTPATPVTDKKQPVNREQATAAANKTVPYVRNEAADKTLPSANRRVPDIDSSIPAAAVQAETTERRQEFAPPPPANKEKQVMIRGQKNYSLSKLDSLHNQHNALSEVVVVGYSAQRKQNVTGSVSVLKKDAVFKSDTQNVMQGKVAGVEVSSDDTDINAYRKPAPVTGETAFENYLKTKTVNPDNQYQGTVRVSFIVMPDGSLQDFKIIRHLNDACDAEAIRVIKEGPAWIPASDGKSAKVKVRVKFNVQKDK